MGTQTLLVWLSLEGIRMASHPLTFHEPDLYKIKMSKSRKKGNYPKMLNPYLYEKLAQAHYQELLHEAEKQRMLAQLPRRHPPLMRNIAGQLAAFLKSLPFLAKKVMQPARRVTGEL